MVETQAGEQWSGLPSDHEIRRVFGAPTYERAAAYVRAGRVSQLHGSPSGGAILATVAGSRPSPYQAVALLGGRAGTLLSGRCTCPVAVDCKHVAAVFIAARADADRPDAEATPRPAWERALAGVIGGPQPEDGAGTPLGLLFEPFSRGAPDARHLRMRPVVPGRKTAWVRQGVSWRSLEFDYSRRYSVRQREALDDLAQTHRGRSHYYYGDAEVELDNFGPELWPLLREVVASGVTLVPHKTLGGTVTVAVRPAEVALDLTQPDPEADAVLAPSITLDGAVLRGRVALVGEPAHGLVAYGAKEGLVLAALSAPVSPQVAELLAGDRLRIPPDDVDRFVREYYPSLRQVVTVTSSDETVDLPEITPPRLGLRLTYADGHRLSLAWSFRYEVAGKVEAVPLGGPGPAAVARDHDGEQRLLRDLRLPPHLPQLRGPAPEHALVAGVDLRGVDAAVFTEDVLPELRAQDDVVIDVVGTVPDYRLEESAPVIRVSATDSDDADWFDLGVSVDLNGEHVPFRNLFVALARGDTHLVLLSGTYFRIDTPELDQLRRLIAEARELTDRPSDNLQISTFQVGLWDELRELGVVDAQSRRWEERVARLLAAEDTGDAPPPAGLDAELRPYQLDGYRWLSYLMDAGLGGILADDMGLGKTVQTLAAICRTQEAGRLTAPVLVVAPTSVVSGWANEAARFAPGLSVTTVSQTQNKSGVLLSEHVAGSDVVVTSYALFRIDEAAYAGLPWSGLVLDEAQFVKNHQAKTYQCARKLNAPFKLAISGTPLENSLMDLWSLLSIVAPGMFPDPKHFAETYRKPIETGSSPELLAALRRRIGPFIRRRTKEQVVTELPPKQEQVLTVTLNPRHQKIYQTHLQRERRKILGLIDDMDKNRFTIFRSLTLLRQLSLDPALVDEKYAGVSSSKADAFLENLEEVISGGHRALVFSQFTSFLGTVRTRLEAAGVDYVYLDGRTRDRARRIEEFKTGTAPVFLISLKAGGFGLNLTEADYCFVLDPWWNPAVETQAVDRAHRIGQDKTVMVYRLVAAGTIEEKVMELKARKQGLFDRVMDDDALLSSPMSADDIRGLLAG
ncbi:DEAD/DEAH box helicase [Georgenia wangjunii]|uniref:DEAD/DEAH box helicase n=1 Tax=Georgenia wangjunii TaxID=3117730 RepID=UPI002F26C585